VLARLGVRIVVADLSQVQLEMNLQHANQYDFASAIEAWVQMHICDMARFAPESFDCVVAYGSLLGYVLDQRDKALAECLCVLKRERNGMSFCAWKWKPARKENHGT